MFRSKTTAALLASTLSISSPLFAQTAAENDIPEIIVTAKGSRSLQDTLPTTHVFTAADIELAQVNDLPELLARLSGVNISDTGGRGSVTSVFVRGTSNSQIIVLIDGVRVGSASLGSAALNTYPIEAIQRVEVVKGPLSGIYGADAAGGVIQLFTKKGGEGRGSANATIGSDALVDVGMAFSGGNDKHSFHVSAQYEETDGFDRTSITSGGNDDEDAFEETAFSLGAKVTLNDATVANLSVLYSDGSADFDNTFGADTGFVTETTTTSVALNLSSQLNDSVVWNTTFGINEDESVTDVFFSDITTKRNSIGSEIEYALNSNSTVIVGADYYKEELEALVTFPVDERDNTGLFALLQSNTGAFGFVGSLRYDDNSAYGTDSNGSVALSYDFKNDTRIIASYGSAFIAPSFNFLYFPFFGNPDLLPEESDSVELSLVGTNERFDWRVSAYQTDIENLFSFNPSTFLAANIGAAEIQGVEFEVQTIVANWDISAQLDILSAEDKDSGLELDDRAEKSFALSAARDFGKLNLRFDANFEEGRHDSRGTELASYGLLDVNARYSVNDHLTLLAKIDNLFDKDYTTNLVGFGDRYENPGRKAKLTLKYNF